MSTTFSSSAPSPRSAAHPPGEAGHGRRRGPVPTVRLNKPTRSRSLPYIVAGLALGLACAMGFGIISLRLGGRTPVLVLTRAVPAGHVLSAGDVRVERVAAGPGVATIPATDQSAVVGKPVAVPLAAGSLLSASVLGTADFPPEGKALIAVAVKDGQYPPELTAGARVAVAAGPAPGGAGERDTVPGGDLSLRGRPTATVASVRPAEGQGGMTVVSLLVSLEQAGEISGIPPDQVDLVALPLRGGS